MDRSLLEYLSLEADLLDPGVVAPEDVKPSESVAVLVERLIEDGRLNEAAVLEAVARRMGVPYMDVSRSEIEPEVVDLISAKTARRHQLVPLFRFDNTVSVALSNPHDVAALDAARQECGCEVEPVLSSAEAIARLVEATYGREDGGQDTLDRLSDQALPETGAAPDAILSHLEEDLAGAPVVKIVDLVLQKALLEEASDVHIEPGDRSLRIRFRVDGRLHDMATPNWQLFLPIVSRIKILASMDIAEKRLPQDGRFEYRSGQRAADIRVSTYPTAHGESVVLRILDKARNLLTLEELGFEGDALKQYGHLIKRPYGILLVTGPTGSGKTTTLYASLTSLKSPEKNVMTLEDPVEYRIPGIRQTQVNTKAGLTFATGLRAILRQDPDILMVGEIRDRDALDMAIRSAMTGHLVLSTLHTNDAPSSLVRLVDMGAEPFLVASTVIGVMAQRLVRRVCDRCRTEYDPPERDLEEARARGWSYPGPFYRGRGCTACRGSGFHGRIGVFELMVMGEEVERLVVEKASASAIARAARGQGMAPLREAALAKVEAGATTLDEVLAVTAAF
jgi:type IV pilus assembly protein PilB